jgi:hypothetical protein
MWILVALLVAVGGCSKDNGGGSGAPAGVTFTKVDLPGGSGVPVKLAADGKTLLIGTRRDGQPLVPGLLRRESDGKVSEIPSQGASPYGLIARWFSIVSDGDRILGIGGENGGAHGNVRWSVWTGGSSGISEKAQAFSTFSGYGSGELTDMVITPSGPAIIGTWQSAKAGYDLATWLPDGDSWNRQESAGTPLESTLDELGFPVAATALRQGVLVAGWALTSKPGSGPTPYAWQSSSGVTGWTKAALPDAGHDGAAMSVNCWDSTCAIAGRVDGKLAVWQLTGGSWARVAGEPPVPVSDKDHLAAPLRLDGKLTLLVSDNGQVKIAQADGAKWTVRTVSGPTGTVTATAVVDGAVYLVAGPDDNNQTVWRVDAGALSR